MPADLDDSHRAESPSAPSFRDRSGASGERPTSRTKAACSGRSPVPKAPALDSPSRQRHKEKRHKDKSSRGEEGGKSKKEARGAKDEGTARHQQRHRDRSRSRSQGRHASRSRSRQRRASRSRSHSRKGRRSDNRRRGGLGRSRSPGPLNGKGTVGTGSGTAAAAAAPRVVMPSHTPAAASHGDAHVTAPGSPKSPSQCRPPCSESRSPVRLRGSRDAGPLPPPPPLPAAGGFDSLPLPPPPPLPQLPPPPPRSPHRTHTRSSSPPLRSSRASPPLRARSPARRRSLDRRDSQRDSWRDNERDWASGKDNGTSRGDRRDEPSRRDEAGRRDDSERRDASDGRHDDSRGRHESSRQDVSHQRDDSNGRDRPRPDVDRRDASRRRDEAGHERPRRTSPSYHQQRQASPPLPGPPTGQAGGSDGRSPSRPDTDRPHATNGGADGGGSGGGRDADVPAASPAKRPKLVSPVRPQAPLSDKSAKAVPPAAAAAAAPVPRKVLLSFGDELDEEEEEGEVAAAAAAAAADAEAGGGERGEGSPFSPRNAVSKGVADGAPRKPGGGFSLSASTANRFQKERSLAGRAATAANGGGSGYGFGGGPLSSAILLARAPAVPRPRLALQSWGDSRTAGSGSAAIADADGDDDSGVGGTPLVLGRVVFGVALACGMRPYMEDRYVLVSHLSLLGADGAPLAGATGGDGLERSFAAVYDGHNGARCAEGAAGRLHKVLAADPALRNHTGSPAVQHAVEEAAVGGALKRAFNQVDREFLEHARAEGWRDGSTAVVVMRLGSALFAAHAGDSRAVLCRRGTAVRLTEDHKPNLPLEKARVEAAGGRVEWQRCWRVVVEPRNGRPGSGLAVSRALGDIDFKEPHRFVECAPDVLRMVMRPGDSFVVLASDGLWDVMSDQEACDCATNALGTADAFHRDRSGGAGGGAAPPPGEADARRAAEALLALSMAKHTMDNVTVVVMLLHWA